MLTSNGYVLDESPRRLGDLSVVPDRERADVSRLRERLRRDGHLFLTGLLDPEVVLSFWRAALDNVSDGIRLSTDIRYQRSDAAIDGRWQNDWDDQDGL